MIVFHNYSYRLFYTGYPAQFGGYLQRSLDFRALLWPVTDRTFDGSFRNSDIVPNAEAYAIASFC
jgi:hypothetical protein